MCLLSLSQFWFNYFDKLCTKLCPCTLLRSAPWWAGITWSCPFAVWPLSGLGDGHGRPRRHRVPRHARLDLRVGEHRGSRLLDHPWRRSLRCVRQGLRVHGHRGWPQHLREGLFDASAKVAGPSVWLEEPARGSPLFGGRIRGATVAPDYRRKFGEAAVGPNGLVLAMLMASVSLMRPPRSRAPSVWLGEPAGGRRFSAGRPLC